MDNEKISNFLGELREQANDDMQEYVLKFEDFWERKLWHELTDALVEFYGEQGSAPQRIPVYENFVKSFADKINQLKLVKLGLSTAGQYKGMCSSPCIRHLTRLTFYTQVTKNAFPSSRLLPRA